MTKFLVAYKKNRLYIVEIILEYSNRSMGGTLKIELSLIQTKCVVTPIRGNHHHRWVVGAEAARITGSKSGSKL